jgi:hypothetical protein
MILKWILKSDYDDMVESVSKQLEAFLRLLLGWSDRERLIERET